MTYRDQSRRGLVIAALLALFVLAALDLLRSDSVIRGFLSSMSGSPRTPLQRLLDRVSP